MKTTSIAQSVHPSSIEVFTLDELADYLRLPIESVRRHALQGELPGQVVDGEWRFLRSAIEQWLATPMKNPLVIQGKLTDANLQAAQANKGRLLELLKSWDNPDQEEYQTEVWNQLDQNLPRHQFPSR